MYESPGVNKCGVKNSRRVIQRVDGVWGAEWLLRGVRRRRGVYQ